MFAFSQINTYIVATSLEKALRHTKAAGEKAQKSRLFVWKFGRFFVSYKHNLQ